MGYRPGAADPPFTGGGMEGLEKWSAADLIHICTYIHTYIHTYMCIYIYIYMYMCIVNIIHILYMYHIIRAISSMYARTPRHFLRHLGGSFDSEQNSYALGCGK